MIVYGGAPPAAGASVGCDVTFLPSLREGRRVPEKQRSRDLLLHLASLPRRPTSALASCLLTHRTPSSPPQGTLGRPVLYRGTLDCIRQVARQEGMRGFYRAALPSYLKVGLAGWGRTTSTCLHVHVHASAWASECWAVVALCSALDGYRFWD